MADQKSSTRYRDWFNRYMSAASNQMGYYSDVIQEVISDPLDDERIEAHIVRLQHEVTVTGQFCNSCHDVFADWPSNALTSDEPEYKMLHKVNSLSIEAAARNGCYLCELYLQELKDKKMLQVCRRVERRLEDITTQRPLSTVWARPHWSTSELEDITYHITIQWPDKTYGPEGYIVWIDSFSEISATGKMSQPRYHRNAYSCGLADVSDTSRETFDIAKDWLLDCDKEHKSCKTSEAPMPTRLICLLNGSARVVQSDCIGERVLYATLSHCWCLLLLFGYKMRRL